MPKRSSNPGRDVAEGVALEPTSAPTTVINYHGPVTINNIQKTIVKRAKLTPGVVDGVKTNDGQPPREWVDERRGTPQTNVSHVCWAKLKKKWQVQRLDDTGKAMRLGVAATLARACDLRRGVVDGNLGPGELTFDDSGCAFVTKCGQCRKSKPLAAFAPTPCGQNVREFAAFVKACTDLSSTDWHTANAAEDRLAVQPSGKTRDGKALRRTRCRCCRAVERRIKTEGNGASGKCYRAAQAIRADMAARGCSLCTESRAECLECDHPGRKGKIEDRATVTRWTYWAGKHGHNGPDLMWQEYAKCVILCRCCHHQQDSHTHAKAIPLEQLVKGTPLFNARQYTNEKQAYVNALKREIGQCYYCGTEMQCDEGNEHAFQMMHGEDGLTKCCGVADLVKARRPLKTDKPRIDAEMAKCRLGCANCHFYHDTLPAMQIDEDAWDALEAKWIGKRV